MKSLHIIQTPARFYPATGGIENYVFNLSKKLLMLGIKVTAISANEPDSNIREHKGIKIIKLPYYFKIANTNITFSLFFRLMREKFDILHTHFPTPWSADISMLVSLIKRKPLILTYHNDLVKEGIEGVLATIYSSTLLKILFLVSKKIIITSPNYIKFSKYLKGQAKKIIIIPNGVNMLDYSSETKIKKVKNQLFFLSVLDKYHRYKGLDYLLKSISKVIKHFPDVKLLVGGEGELVDEYIKLTKELNISKNVLFLKYLNNFSLKKIYRESSIFVLPSINNNEGFGIVLLEAMASNTAVITTNHAGMATEINRNNCGVIVEPSNSQSLSDAIIKLLKDTKLTEVMGNNGRKLVEEKYSWKNLSLEINRIYQELL